MWNVFSLGLNHGEHLAIWALTESGFRQLLYRYLLSLLSPSVGQNRPISDQPLKITDGIQHAGLCLIKLYIIYWKQIHPRINKDQIDVECV